MKRHISTPLTTEDQALYEEVFGIAHYSARHSVVTDTPNSPDVEAHVIPIDCGIIDFIPRSYNDVVDWNVGAHGMSKGVVDTYLRK